MGRRQLKFRRFSNQEGAPAIQQDNTRSERDQLSTCGGDSLDFTFKPSQEQERSTDEQHSLSPLGNKSPVHQEQMREDKPSPNSLYISPQNAASTKTLPPMDPDFGDVLSSSSTNSNDAWNSS
eukprot:gene21433-biopygen7360